MLPLVVDEDASRLPGAVPGVLRVPQGATTIEAAHTDEGNPMSHCPTCTCQPRHRVIESCWAGHTGCEVAERHYHGGCPFCDQLRQQAEDKAERAGTKGTR